jgi:hypothetical protein
MLKARKYLLKASNAASAVGIACLPGGFALTAARHAPLWTNQGFVAAYSCFGAFLVCRILAAYMLARQGMVNIATSPDAIRSRPYQREYVRTENLKKDVIKSFRKLTGAQQESLFRDSYYGMWIRLSGEIVDVMSWTGSYAEVKLQVYSWWRTDATLKFCDERFYKNHLSAFKKKTCITVLGQIIRITPNQIFIDNCEILPTGQP